MKRSVMILTAGLVLISLVAILVFALKSDNRVYAEEDAAVINEIEVGDTFVVELKENPSTGFSWHCTIENDRIIYLDSDQFIPAEDEGIVGAPGKHEFIFKALEKGSVQIKFEYYQTWESENVAETYVFNFVVK